LPRHSSASSSSFSSGKVRTPFAGKAVPIYVHLAGSKRKMPPGDPFTSKTNLRPATGLNLIAGDVLAARQSSRAFPEPAAVRQKKFYPSDRWKRMSPAFIDGMRSSEARDGIHTKFQKLWGRRAR